MLNTERTPTVARNRTISSRIDDAKEVAARLGRRVAAVERANENRDKCLYNLLGRLHQLEGQLKGIKGSEALRALRKKFGPRLPTSSTISISLLLQLTYPELSSKTRSKYAAVIRYVGAKKKPGQKVMEFVRENGGINGCVAKEKKLRDKKQKMRKRLGKGKRVR